MEKNKCATNESKNIQQNTEELRAESGSKVVISIFLGSQLD